MEKWQNIKDEKSWDIMEVVIDLEKRIDYLEILIAKAIKDKVLTEEIEEVKGD